MIALRLLEVAGLDPDEDITRRGLGVGESVQALRDGSIDAFFWSGGVPTGAVTDLATTDDIRLLALDRYLPDMRERFGEAYQEAEIEEGEYAASPAVTTIGVPNLLMVNEDMDDELAYDITKALYDGKDRLARRSCRRPRRSTRRRAARSSSPCSCTPARSATTRSRGE